MSGFDIQLDAEGVADIQRQLSNLEEKMQQGAVRAGLVKAAGPVKKRAKSMAPTKTGALKRAIGHKSLSKSAKSRLDITQDKIALLVGPNRNGQGKKGMWQEFGTEDMEANPFLSPALDASRSGFEGRFYEGLSSYLDRKGLKK